MMPPKPAQFKALHRADDPLVLYNIWDAATARAACNQGAKAVATGSWSVDAAHGYDDGQAIPLAFLIQIISRIVKSVDIPVSVDFECGYADDLDRLADNFKAIIDTGAVGINFEDQIIGQGGLQSPSHQARRIEVLANTARAAGVDMFINARTDVFLQQQDETPQAKGIEEAVARGSLYKEAGASGFFVPGLTDAALITHLCDAVALPVNIMTGSNDADIAGLKRLGVSRISYGPHPYFAHISAFEQGVAKALA